MGSGCRRGAAAASLSASTGNGRTGSTGRCVPLGGAASFIFFSADATTSHASSMRTTRDVPRLLSILLVHDRGDPDHAAAGGEDRSAGAAGREHEVGHDGLRLDAAHGPGRHALLLDGAERRS